jgi:hypothetical protein
MKNKRVGPTGKKARQGVGRHELHSTLLSDLALLSSKKDNMATQRRRPTQNDYASVEDVIRWAKKIKTEYLKCRKDGHWWDAYTVDDSEIRTYNAVLETEQCQQCSSFRDRWVSLVTGRRSKAKIRYADQEYLAKHLGRIAGDSKDIINLLVLQREYPQIKALRTTKSSSTTKKTQKATT